MRWGEEKISDAGCLCHLGHLCVGKGAKEFSVDGGNFVIDIYYRFHSSANLDNQLKEFMNFNNNKLRKGTNHDSTSWLGHGKYLDKILMQ